MAAGDPAGGGGEGMTNERWLWLFVCAMLLDNISQEVRGMDSIIGSFMAGIYGVER